MLNVIKESTLIFSFSTPPTIIASIKPIRIDNLPVNRLCFWPYKVNNVSEIKCSEMSISCVFSILCYHRIFETFIEKYFYD